MKFTIIPYVGVDKIHFGMQRDQVRSCLGGMFKEFRKSSDSLNTTDAFDGVHIYYNEDNCCEALEFFSPSEVMFNGYNIIGFAYSLGKKIFEAESTAITEDAYGLDARDLGVGLYAPDYEDDSEALIQGVFVYRRGYYNQ